MSQSLMNRIPVGTGLVTPAAGFGLGSMFAPLSEEERRARNAQAMQEQMSGILAFYRPGNILYDIAQNIGDTSVEYFTPRIKNAGSTLMDLAKRNVEGQGRVSPEMMANVNPNLVTAGYVAQANPTVVTANRLRTDVPKRARLPIRVASGGPQRVRGLGTGSQAYKPADPTGRQLTGPMAQNPLVPVRPRIEEEEEKNPYDGEFFGELITKAYEASLGGKPFRPDGFSAGTLRNFTALPFFRR